MNYPAQPDLSDLSPEQIRRIEKYYLTARIEKLEAALKRISQHSTELEGTAATWKDVALSMERIATQALKN